VTLCRHCSPGEVLAGDIAALVGTLADEQVDRLIGPADDSPASALLSWIAARSVHAPPAVWQAPFPGVASTTSA